MIKFKTTVDAQLLQLSEWLMGYDGDNPPSNWRFSTWNHSRRRLSSPLTWQQREVKRFSLDRGFHFDVREAGLDDPRQQLLDIIFRENHLEDLVSLAFERGSLTGSIYWLYGLDPDRYYRLMLYDATEVMEYDGDLGKGWAIQVRGGAGFYQRKIVTDNDLFKFAPNRNPHSEWGNPTETVRHGYGFLPGVKTVHRLRDHAGTARPEFDWLSLEMALEICSQYLGSAANYNYFGGPFLISGDPRKTLEELLDRRQVLTGRVGSEFQDTGLLSMPAMPDSHKEFLDSLSSNFANYHGLSWVPPEPPGDTSSLTLRLLYGQSVATADKLGNRYLGAVEELLGCILKSAAIDDIVGYREPTTSGQGLIEFTYNNALFPLTPQEKQQQLLVVEQLVQLGIRTEVALQEYYTDLNQDELANLLLGV